MLMACKKKISRLIRKVGNAAGGVGFALYCLYFSVMPALAGQGDSQAGTAGVNANFEILRGMAAAFTREAIEDALKHDAKKFILRISPHSSEWLFEQEFVNRTAEAGITLQKSGDSTGLPIVTVSISKFGVGYDNYTQSSDSVVRTVSMEAASYVCKGGVISAPVRKLLSLRDTLSRKDVAALENSPYEFARGTVPPERKSIWEKTIEPLVLVATAALTVFLFFSVRSN